MTTPNWGMITDGGAFESLMHAILYAENPDIVLFGRPGKDAGQDARSGDGTTVYQAKYRRELTMGSAIPLALKELANIKEYRGDKHANYDHWRRATEWILVANMSINPNDDKKWRKEVGLEFQKIGLIATYWGIEILDRKLEQHANIREVFFGGQNRVLIGLKEAHDLISNESTGCSLELPIIGREAEKRNIHDFIMSSDKRVLPVVGPVGIGKSRLIFEALVEASATGRRTYWALPSTMARSSQWVHLLHSSTPTCIAIDDPDDPNLLRSALEQLATVEWRNWKIIVSTRPGVAESILPLQSNKLIAEQLVLVPLAESDAKTLLRGKLTVQLPESWLHSVYQYSRGVPGWMCLIADLANRNDLSSLPSDVAAWANSYVDLCIAQLDSSDHMSARTLLRWVALWGTLSLEDSRDQVELIFLDTQGVPLPRIPDLLKRLVDSRLLRNWGVGKRLYAVEPPIIRDHIVGEWLFNYDENTNRVNHAGKWLVDRIVQGDVPAIDKVLGTISHLTSMRLEDAAGHSFLRPVFESMRTIVQEGTVVDQYRVLALVEKAGYADPESALEVLTAIRNNPKYEATVEGSLWGPQTFTHPSLVTKLPWVVFQVAENVSDPNVARRYLNEFRALLSLESTSSGQVERGKGVTELLDRILRKSKCSPAFASPARGLIQAELTLPNSIGFVEVLLKALLNPEREAVQWTGTWTMTITRQMLVPNSSGWNNLIELRNEVWEVLRTSTDSDVRPRLWRVLAESHHQIHRVAMQEGVKGDASLRYRKILVDDLKHCEAVLKAPPLVLTMEEVTHARNLWSWYLEYGREGDLANQALKCEAVYNNLTPWRMHDFFRFGLPEQLAPETERVVQALRNCENVQCYHDFFEEAERYLQAERNGRKDGMDWVRIASIANDLADQFVPRDIGTTDPLTSYVSSVLALGHIDDSLPWFFAIRICERYIGRAKHSGDEDLVAGELRFLLGMTNTAQWLLFDLYSNAHPESTQPLHKAELDCILELESSFTNHQLFVLLGVFAATDWPRVRPYLIARLEDNREQLVEISNWVGAFVASLYIVSRRYTFDPTSLPIGWILNVITDFCLDGSLLEMYLLTGLRDYCEFKLTMAQLVKLIRSRIELERSRAMDYSFQILPHNFDVGEWCHVDYNRPGDVLAFHEFCALALESSFTSLYSIPKFVAQLDESGQQVASYVEQYLVLNPGIDRRTLAQLACLASAYSETSLAWAAIANPICRMAIDMNRDDRMRIYSGLTRKESGVISSGPGEVPDYYIQRLDDAVRMLQGEPLTSPLRGYREWAVEVAEAELQWERGRAEEDAND
ncbi:MAG TPA: hypothetical protein VHI13_10740 [Candidatus Kapabacteria bacterium]|nr:hypothetical protein [Candidatus Kapabacteria bacterium]